MCYNSCNVFRRSKLPQLHCLPLVLVGQIHCTVHYITDPQNQFLKNQSPTDLGFLSIILCICHHCWRRRRIEAKKSPIQEFVTGLWSAVQRCAQSRLVSFHHRWKSNNSPGSRRGGIEILFFLLLVKKLRPPPPSPFLDALASLGSMLESDWVMFLRFGQILGIFSE